MAGLNVTGKMKNPFTSKFGHVFRLEFALLVMSVTIICLNGAAYSHWSLFQGGFAYAFHYNTYFGSVPHVLKQLSSLFFIAPAFSAVRALIQVIIIATEVPVATSVVMHWINVVILNSVFAICYIPQTIIMSFFIHDGGQIGAPQVFEIISTVLCVGMFVTYILSMIVALCMRKTSSPQGTMEVAEELAYGEPCKLCGQPTLAKQPEGIRTPELPAYPGHEFQPSSHYDTGHDTMSDVTLDKAIPEQSHDLVDKNMFEADSSSLSSPQSSSKSFWDMSLHELHKQRKLNRGGGGGKN